MDMDLFGDLMPKNASLPSVSGGSASETRAERGPRSTHRPEVPDVFSPDAEIAKARMDSPIGNGKPGASADMVCSFTKEQLREMLAETVQHAVDETFSKLVKSLRTVRTSCQMALHAESQPYETYD